MGRAEDAVTEGSQEATAILAAALERASSKREVIGVRRVVAGQSCGLGCRAPAGTDGQLPSKQLPLGAEEADAHVKAEPAAAEIPMAAFVETTSAAQMPPAASSEKTPPAASSEKE